ncbi:MAG: multicopper oxidase domain-containing protein [Thermodesulfobacteriota bacterium]
MKRVLLIAAAMIAINGTTLLAAEHPVKKFYFNVEEKKITLLREPEKAATVWAFNGTVPGPVMRVNKGDRVKIYFENTSGNPHSIHIHGSHPFEMDGTGDKELHPNHAQDPQTEFVYDFIAEEPGYYPYHCHVDAAKHMDMGMYGLLIVEDPAQKKTYDREFISFWDEWDIDGDGVYETHTINSKSYPDTEPLKAKVGERIRIVMVAFGYEVHAPHIHGAVADVLDQFTGAKLYKSDTEMFTTAQVRVMEASFKHKGKWMFHCHVEPHIVDDGEYPRGMMTFIEVE